MKKIMLVGCSVILSMTTFSQHQIRNTKWKGHIEVPQSLDIVLDFRNDSLIATSAEGMELEIMFFSQSKDTLQLRKLNGQSPCDHVTEGFYLLVWVATGDKLVLQMIKDDCKARSSSITSGVGYFRVKD